MVKPWTEEDKTIEIGRRLPATEPTVNAVSFETITQLDDRMWFDAEPSARIVPPPPRLPIARRPSPLPIPREAAAPILTVVRTSKPAPVLAWLALGLFWTSLAALSYAAATL